MRISVKVLADFMSASPSRQRSIIRDSKYPRLRDGKSRPQIVRYSEARAAIRKYHASENDITVLLTAVEKLTRKRSEHPDMDSARIEDNIRAIKAYITYFSQNNFSILPTPRPVYSLGQMEVSASPDLFAVEEGTKKLIKLDFNQKEPKEATIQIVLRIMYEAALAQQLGVRPLDVIYLDVSRRRQYVGTKLTKKLKRDVDAALTTIQDMWANINRE